MKHLRLYENFNEYYWELNVAEANDFFKPKKRVGFHDRQLDIIKKHLEGWTRNISSLRFATMSFEYGRSLNDLRNRRVKILHIYAYDDEYFYCTTSPHDRNDYFGRYRHYVCDGFDGLIKFLDDLHQLRNRFRF